MSTVGRVQSLLAQRVYRVQDRGTARVIEQLATGSRINRGGDDPSGLVASEHLRNELARLETETRALERADAVARVAEGALQQISSLLMEAQSLAVARASPGAYSAAELDAFQIEMDSIISSVDRIAGTTSFNGSGLLDGTAILTAAGESVAIPSASSADIGAVTRGGVTLTGARFGGAIAQDPAAAFASARAAGAAVGAILGRIGAFQRGTLGPAMRSHGVAIENVAAAHSAIRDTDYAAASAALARAVALRDAAGSVLGVANSQPATVFRLLGGV